MMSVLDVMKRRSSMGGNISPVAHQIRNLYFNNNSKTSLSLKACISCSQTSSLDDMNPENGYQDRTLSEMMEMPDPRVVKEQEAETDEQEQADARKKEQEEADAQKKEQEEADARKKEQEQADTPKKDQKHPDATHKVQADTKGKEADAKTKEASAKDKKLPKTKKKREKTAYHVKAGVCLDVVCGQFVVTNIADDFFQVDEDVTPIVKRNNLTPPFYRNSPEYYSDKEKNRIQVLQSLSRLGFLVQYGHVEGDIAHADSTKDKLCSCTCSDCCKTCYYKTKASCESFFFDKLGCYWD